MSGEASFADALAIRGPLTVATVAATRGVLLQRLVAAADVVCDLQAVDTCDTAGIQLLCSAAVTARALGARWQMRASPAVNDAARRAGVDLAALEVVSR